MTAAHAGRDIQDSAAAWTRGKAGRRGRIGGLVALAAALGACAEPTMIRSSIGGLEASPPAVDFAPTTLGLEDRRAVTLAQRGLLPADITGISLDPADAPFDLSALPRLVGRGRSVTLQVAFRPRTAGPLRARLTLTFAEGEPLAIELQGRGVDARAEPMHPIEFGRPAVGAVRRRTLWLRNVSETAVPVRLSMAGPDAGEFSVTGSVVVGPFSELAANLRWEPHGRAGRRDVTLRLVACPLCSPEELPVGADAVPEPLVVTPDPVEVGSVTIDSEGRRSVLITNATDELIAVSDVRLGETTDPGFALDVPAFPVLLPGLDSVSVQVRFSPTRLGTGRGTLEVHSDAEPVGLKSAALHASGGGAQLVVAPARLDFRTQPAGMRSVLPVTVANGGADPAAPPLTLTGLQIAGAGFEIARGFAPGTTLAAGERLELSIAFHPDVEGAFAGPLTVSSDDPGAPTAEVLLHGASRAAVDCQLTATPDALEFGSPPANRAATLGVRITNTGGDPCSLWDGRVEGDPAFSLAKPRSAVTLGPGDAFLTPIRFEPTGPGERQATLVFDTSRLGAARFAAPLAGGLDPGCLRAEPNQLDFGPRRPSCGPRELVATFRNLCAAPVEVGELALGRGTDPNAFAIVDATPVPRTLASGERVEARIRFTPALPGYAYQPLFVRGDDSQLPRITPLSGESLAELPREERWVQPAPAKLDLLFVIDNTASMKDERAALARSVAGFLADADVRGIDYRIGVTSTGMTPAPGGGAACTGGADGGEAGRLHPVDHARPRIVDPGLADRADVLAANIDVGACHSVEQGLEAARAALSPPLVDNPDDHRTAAPLDGNLGLVRPDAALAIVVVSDEDDESPGELRPRLEALRRIKPTSPVSFSAIVAPAAGCASAVEPGVRYLEAVAELDGVTASVCAADWSAGLAVIADDLFQVRDRYLLAASADPATIEVTLDGVPTAAWRYEPARRAVVLDPPAAPGAEIVIRYQEPCP